MQHRHVRTAIMLAVVHKAVKHRLRTSRIISTCVVLLLLILYLNAGCKKNQFRRYKTSAGNRRKLDKADIILLQKYSSIQNKKML